MEMFQILSQGYDEMISPGKNLSSLYHNEIFFKNYKLTSEVVKTFVSSATKTIVRISLSSFISGILI